VQALIGSSSSQISRSLRRSVCGLRGCTREAHRRWKGWARRDQHSGRIRDVCCDRWQGRAARVTPSSWVWNN